MPYFPVRHSINPISLKLGILKELVGDVKPIPGTAVEMNGRILQSPEYLHHLMCCQAGFNRRRQVWLIRMCILKISQFWRLQISCMIWSLCISNHVLGMIFRGRARRRYPSMLSRYPQLKDCLWHLPLIWHKVTADGYDPHPPDCPKNTFDPAMHYNSYRCQAKIGWGCMNYTMLLLSLSTRLFWVSSIWSGLHYLLIHQG